MSELYPGSLILPIKVFINTQAPPKNDVADIMAPKLTNNFKGLSEKDTITLKASDISFPKL